MAQTYEDKPTLAAWNAMAAAAAGAGNCRIVTGRYRGAGVYGADNRNSLTFDGKPMLVIIRQEYHESSFNCDYKLVAMRGTDWACTFPTSSDSSIAHLTWTDNGLSWYAQRSAVDQLNAIRYYAYIAFLLTDDETE